MSGVTRGDFGRLRNEAQANQTRLDRLEAWVYVFSHMSFLRRMRWLLTGK
jgi:hypothetical protein